MREETEDSNDENEGVGFFRIFIVVVIYNIFAEILGVWLYKPLAKGLGAFIVLLLFYPLAKTSRSTSFAKWLLYCTGAGLFFFLGGMWFGK